MNFRVIKYWVWKITILPGECPKNFMKFGAFLEEECLILCTKIHEKITMGTLLTTANQCTILRRCVYTSLDEWKSLKAELGSKYLDEICTVGEANAEHQSWKISFSYLWYFRICGKMIKTFAPAEVDVSFCSAGTLQLLIMSLQMVSAVRGVSSLFEA